MRKAIGILSALAISIGLIGYSLIKELYNPIINRPVKTVELLEPITTLPINKIFNPTYEYTTNTGIVRHPNTDGYIVSFHTDIAPSTKFYRTKLHLATLDKDFNVQTHYEVQHYAHYKFYPNHWSYLSSAQDPRLFNFKDKIYMLYNDSVESPFREVYIGEVQLNGNKIATDKLIKLNYAEGSYRDQKNWSPFTYQDQIYFIYTTHPHLILNWDQKTNTVNKAYDNGTTFGKQWPYGEIRGSTPAIYVKELDAYLSFFHSMLKYRKKEPRVRQTHQPFARIYYTGAFLFESKPPFKIIAYTPTPLSFKGQYKPLDVAYHIIFPCGIYEESDAFIISAGIQDIKTTMFSINKQALYKQFVYLDGAA